LHGKFGGGKTRIHFLEFRVRLFLDADMVHARFFAPLRYCEVHCRVTQFPLALVDFPDGGFDVAEHRAVEPDAVVQIVDTYMDVHPFHAESPQQLGTSLAGQVVPAQQFSVRKPINPVMASNFAMKLVVSPMQAEFRVNGVFPVRHAGARTGNCSVSRPGRAPIAGTVGDY
jgi:hypothetical protein